MSDLAGQLDIQIRRGGADPSVSIGSTRPVTAARVFAGTPVATVGAQLPLLFSVCGTAQALAFARACEVALAREPRQATRHARALLVRAERVKEHLWRLLLDWPKALEPIALEDPAVHPLPPGGVDERAVAAVMRAFLALRSAVSAAADPFLPGVVLPEPPADAVVRASDLMISTAASQVFGMAPAQWLSTIRDGGSLRSWASEADTVAAWLVRTLDATGVAAFGCPAGAGERAVLGDLGPDLLALLAPLLGGEDADAFVERPALPEGPAETTPFSRELVLSEAVADLAGAIGNGLLPRLAGLLSELARDCVRLKDLQARGAEPAATPVDAALSESPHSGLGAAAAARGLLVHRVVLDAQLEVPTVRDYRILAPTEWNFHPAGVVARALAGLAERADLNDEQLALRARLFVTAVDPCVDYQLNLV